MQVNLKTLTALNKYAGSTEATRYYLNGVFVHSDEDWVYAVATDGHRMLVHRFTNEDSVNWSFIVPSDLLKKLRFDRKHDGIGSLTFGGGIISVGLNGATFTGEPVDGTFPDYRRVRPADSGEVKAAHFDSKYVADMSAFSKDTDKGKAILTPRGLDPALFTFTGDNNTYGVLMPVKAAFAAKAPF